MAPSPSLSKTVSALRCALFGEPITGTHAHITGAALAASLLPALSEPPVRTHERSGYRTGERENFSWNYSAFGGATRILMASAASTD